MRSISTLAGLGILAACGQASAADLPSNRPPLAPPSIIEPSRAFSWSGFYAGVYGGGFANASTLTTAVASDTENGGGGLVGAGGGYNWELRGGIVLGVEADAGYRSKINVSTPNISQSSTTDGFLGTVRARAGYSFDHVLVYATGGAAFGNTIAPINLNIPAYGYSGVRSGANGGVQAGWVLGAGVEFAVSNSWSIKGEYLYASLGNKTLNYVDPTTGLTTGLTPTKIAVHVFRAGLNYRFASDFPSAVIARY